MLKKWKKAKPGRVSHVSGSGGDDFYQPVYHKTLSFRDYKNLEVFDGSWLDTYDINILIVVFLIYKNYI